MDNDTLMERYRGILGRMAAEQGRTDGTVYVSSRAKEYRILASGAYRRNEALDDLIEEAGFRRDPSDLAQTLAEAADADGGVRLVTGTTLYDRVDYAAKRDGVSIGEVLGRYGLRYITLGEEKERKIRETLLSEAEDGRVHLNVGTKTYRSISYYAGKRGVSIAEYLADIGLVNVRKNAAAES